MQKFNLTSGTFTEISSGSGACIIQVQRGSMGVHIGAGTPDPESVITFGVGEKWIVPAGNQIRARGFGVNSVVMVGDLVDG